MTPNAHLLLAPLGLVFVAASLGLDRYLTGRLELGLGALARRGLGVAIAGGVLLPAAIAWPEMIDRLSRHLRGVPALSSVAAIAALVVAIAIFAWLHRRDYFPDVSAPRFVAALLVGGLAARLLYLLIVRPEPVSDFLRMWQSAIYVANHGWPVTDAEFRAIGLPVSSPDHFDGATLGARVILQRTIPYFIPLAALFGSSLWVIRLANLATFAICGVLVYTLGKRWGTERSGRMALALLLFVPETFFALAIPSHDVPGVMWLLVTLLLFDVSRGANDAGRWRLAALYSVLLGGALAVLELQRTPAIFFYLAVVGWLVLAPDRIIAAPRRRFVFLQVVFLLALPALTQKGLAGLVRQQGWSVTAEQGEKLQAMWITAHNDSWSDGSFTHWFQDYYTAYGGYINNEGPSTAEWKQLARTKYLSDLIDHPRERGGLYQIKARQLFTLGDQPNFYFPNQHTEWGLLPRRWTRSALVTLNRVFVVFYLPLLLLVAWRRVTERSAPGPLLALLLLTLQPLVLLLLGQGQSRYMFVVWFILPLLLVCRERDPTAAAWRSLGHATSVGLLGVGVVALALAAASAVGSGADWRMIELGPPTPPSVGAGNPYRIALTLEPGATAHSGHRTLTGTPPGSTLRLYARRPYVAAARRVPGDLVASVAAGDEVREVTLGTGTSAVAVELPIAGSPAELGVTFAVRTASAAGPDVDPKARSVFFEFAQRLKTSSPRSDSSLRRAD